MERDRPRAAVPHREAVPREVRHALYTVAAAAMPLARHRCSRRHVVGGGCVLHGCRYQNIVSSAVEKRPWTKQEDEELFKLHSLLGNKWVTIAACLYKRYVLRAVVPTTRVVRCSALAPRPLRANGGPAAAALRNARLV